jgi:hypothetical protein
MYRTDKPDASQPPSAPGSDSLPRVVVVDKTGRAQIPLALTLGLMLIAFSAFLLRNDGPLHAIVDRGLWAESVLAVPGALGALLIARTLASLRRHRQASVL